MDFDTFLKLSVASVMGFLMWLQKRGMDKTNDLEKKVAILETKEEDRKEFENDVKTEMKGVKELLTEIRIMIASNNKGK